LGIQASAPARRVLGNVCNFVRVDLRQILAVTDHRLLLEIADDPAGGRQVDEVERDVTGCTFRPGMAADVSKLQRLCSCGLSPVIGRLTLL
jgi:hypothetical protein